MGNECPFPAFKYTYLPPATICWSEYFRQCSLNYNKNLGDLFKRQFKGKIVEWEGAVTSVSSDNAKLIMNPSEATITRSEVTVKFPPEVNKGASPPFQLNSKVRFRGVLDDFGLLSNHQVSAVRLDAAHPPDYQLTYGAFLQIFGADAQGAAPNNFLKFWKNQPIVLEVSFMKFKEAPEYNLEGCSHKLDFKLSSMFKDFPEEPIRMLVPSARQDLFNKCVNARPDQIFNVQAHFLIRNDKHTLFLERIDGPLIKASNAIPFSGVNPTGQYQQQQYQQQQQQLQGQMQGSVVPIGGNVNPVSPIAISIMKPPGQIYQPQTGIIQSPYYQQPVQPIGQQQQQPIQSIQQQIQNPSYYPQTATSNIPPYLQPQSQSPTPYIQTQIPVPSNQNANININQQQQLQQQQLPVRILLPPPMQFNTQTNTQQQQQQQQQQQYQQQQSNPNLPIVLPKPPTRPIGTITPSAPPLEDDDYSYDSNTRMNDNTNSANQLPKPPDILPSQPNYQSSSISSVSGASNDGLEPYPSLTPIGSNDSNTNTNKDQNQKSPNDNADYGIYSMTF